MLRNTALLTAAVALIVTMGGCPTTSTTDQSLTVIQTAAVEAALNGTAGLASTADIAQAASESEGKDQTSQSLDDISFGQCPAVTLSNLSIALRTASATLDFGTGCTPYDGSSYTWSGEAAGQLDLANMTIAAQFSSLTAGPYALDGEFDLNWQRSSAVILLEGDWNFETTNGDTTAGVDGAGSAAYNRMSPAVTIDFEGGLKYESNDWTASLKDILVSYIANENLVPMDGTATITGTEVGTLTLTFDENSPKTGEIMVQINGGPAFPYTLAAFE